MSYTDALLLGLIQGITELLPVSSSGHLIASKAVFELADPGLPFDVFLHVATLAAIIVYFWSDIRELLVSFGRIVRGNRIPKRDRNMIAAITLGTLPAGVLGFFFAREIENIFWHPTSVVFALLLGAGLMAFSEMVARGTRDVTPRRGFWIGCFQALALMPGMSRSGSTIAGSFILGLSRKDAVTFSFLLGLPVIAGAGLKTALELESLWVFFTGPVLFGGAVAFLSGLAAVHFLVRFISSNRLTPFIIYRIALGVVLFFMIN